jgi:arginyl-tRNA synthetase
LLRAELARLIASAVRDAIAAGELPETAASVPIEISDTKTPEHGDFACNFALVATKALGIPPRTIGERLSARLAKDSAFAGVEVAGPGFLNLRLEASFVSKWVRWVIQNPSDLPRVDVGKGEPVNVEFVSVNPNGPITIGSGRGAAFGDTVCRVLTVAGFTPHREYYINDGVNSEQMRLFAESVKHYYRDSLGKYSVFPEKGYRGEYVTDVAKDLLAVHGDAHTEAETLWFQRQSQEKMIERQRTDLHRFRVDFDTWFSEQSMHDAGAVKEAISYLESRGNAYRAAKSANPGPPRPDLAPAPANDEEEDEPTTGGEALWLRSSAFGDEKDRVLVRADGRPAYISADVAYLANKFGRGFGKLKLILGPDHHGYIGRMYAACGALGHTVGHDGEFEIIIYQVVRFVKEGKPAPMRKRDGNIYELRDLISELGASAAPAASADEQQRIGADVSRFFFLMRSHESHMDFDIDLATKQSDENPVFYAQYAHARICSVLARAESSGFPVGEEFNFTRLTNPRELALVRKILDLSFEVERSAKDYGVHRIATYAVELARSFHYFYDACRVVQPEEPDLSRARVALCLACKIALGATFELIGVSAPQEMRRGEV